MARIRVQRGRGRRDREAGHGGEYRRPRALLDRGRGRGAEGPRRRPRAGGRGRRAREAWRGPGQRRREARRRARRRGRASGRRRGGGRAREAARRGGRPRREGQGDEGARGHRPRARGVPPRSSSARRRSQLEPRSPPQRDIAEAQAQGAGRGDEHAKINIVGGDGAFFDRFVRAVGTGQAIDGTIDNSETLKKLLGEYLDGQKSLPGDLKEILRGRRSTPTACRS